MRRTVRAVFLPLAIALLLCPGASAGIITLNSETGSVGGGFGAGTAGWSVNVDSVSQLCTWTFHGDLNIAGDTMIIVTGNNRVSLTAQRHITIGTPGSGAVVFTAMPSTTGGVAGGGDGGTKGDGSSGSPGTSGGGGGWGGDGGSMWAWEHQGHDGGNGSSPYTAVQPPGGDAGDGSQGAGSASDGTATGGEGPPVIFDTGPVYGHYGSHGLSLIHI